MQLHDNCWHFYRSITDLLYIVFTWRHSVRHTQVLSVPTIQWTIQCRALPRALMLLRLGRLCKGLGTELCGCKLFIRTSFYIACFTPSDLLQIYKRFYISNSPDYLTQITYSRSFFQLFYLYRLWSQGILTEKLVCRSTASAVWQTPRQGQRCRMLCNLTVTMDVPGASTPEFA